MFFIWTCVWRHAVEVCVCCLNYFVLKCFKMRPSIVTRTQKVPLQKVGRDELPWSGCIVYENIMFLHVVRLTMWMHSFHMMVWRSGWHSANRVNHMKCTTLNSILYSHCNPPCLRINTPQNTCSHQSIVSPVLRQKASSLLNSFLTASPKTPCNTTLAIEQMFWLSKVCQLIMTGQWHWTGQTLNSPYTSLTHIIKVLLISYDWGLGRYSMYKALTQPPSPAVRALTEQLPVQCAQNMPQNSVAFLM